MYKYPAPQMGDVYEETDVRHQPRRFRVTGPYERETEWTRAKIGLKRIKPNGQLGNVSYMHDPERLKKGEGMRLVERNGKPYADPFATISLKPKAIYKPCERCNETGHDPAGGDCSKCDGTGTEWTPTGSARVH